VEGEGAGGLIQRSKPQHSPLKATTAAAAGGDSASGQEQQQQQQQGKEEDAKRRRAEEQAKILMQEFSGVHRPKGESPAVPAAAGERRRVVKVRSGSDRPLDLAASYHTFYTYMSKYMSMRESIARPSDPFAA
jgi:hypothetical protein